MLHRQSQCVENTPVRLSGVLRPAGTAGEKHTSELIPKKKPAPEAARDITKAQAKENRKRKQYKEYSFPHIVSLS
jgi:hypothetical protein